MISYTFDCGFDNNYLNVPFNSLNPIGMISANITHDTFILPDTYTYQNTYTYISEDICLSPEIMFPTNQFNNPTHIFPSTAPDDDICPICHENNENNKNDWIVLPCTHKFHLNCCLKWFDICVNCPMCRSDNLTGNTVSIPF